jgi:hypothetical protein
MAKSSKKSKESPITDPGPVAPVTEAQNGNGTAKPAKEISAKNATRKSGKSTEEIKPAARTRARTPRKAAATRKSRAGISRGAAGRSELVVSEDEIRVRAYFIAEQRLREGRPGSSDHDWLEARRQLLDEVAQRA